MEKNPISIKEYTKFVADKYGIELCDDEVDQLMFSFGFVYDAKCHTDVKPFYTQEELVYPL